MGLVLAALVAAVPAGFAPPVETGEQARRVLLEAGQLASAPLPEPPGSPPAAVTVDVFPAEGGTRVVHEQAWSPFATVGGVVVLHPSARVERIGFHESNDEGAMELAVLPTASAPVTLSTRGRGTDARTAADVVVDPDVEIRAPVSGRVLRAGSYVLYCRHIDHFVVIEPDDHPGWEVKLLHLAATRVRAGQRVEAGVTVLAPGPTRLPFASQVEEGAARPAWPHVHVEVDDPSIPDLPGTGGC